MKTFWVAVATLGVAPTALAHNLWIEPGADGRLWALYGEPELRLRERSPGRLDMLVLASAAPGETGSPPPAWRKADTGFLLPGPQAASDATVEAQATAVRDGTHGPARLLYHARHAAWPPLPVRPAALLDIVPAAAPDTYAVFFNGAPLTRGTLKVIAPSLWLQVHDIDAQGLVRIHMPWRGLYVLDVETREARAGELDGRHYDSVVHRATLSFTRPDGPAFDHPRPPQHTAD